MGVSGNLSMYSPTLWLFVILLCLWTIYRCVKIFLIMKHIKKLPGPKGIPILGNIDLTFLNPVDLFMILRHFTKTYGSIYKISVGAAAAVITVSADDIEILISQMKHLKKSDTYIPLNDWLKEGLLLSSGTKWQHRRKLLTPTFHFTILNQFTKTFIEESNKLTRNINKILNQPVDVLSIVTNFTLQSICETAMGAKLDQFEEGEKYKDAIYETGSLVIDRCMTPWQHIDILHKFSSNYWKSRSLFKYLHKFTTTIIKNREKCLKLSDVDLKENTINTRKRMAMLDLLLSAKLKNNIGDKGIQEEVDTFMFEGHDTTAASITFSLMLLANHQDIQDKVFQELLYILGGSIREFTMEDLNEMKYLERVIKESLRLYPSVPIFGRTLSEGITTSNGYYIPKGVNVLVNVYDLHRCPNHFKNPEKFDPDRFLSENITGKHPYCYIPFSAGPRNCIGQKFAMLEMKAVIATILRNFELHPIDTPDTIQLKSDIILRCYKPILVKFQKRIYK